MSFLIALCCLLANLLIQPGAAAACEDCMKNCNPNTYAGFGTFTYAEHKTNGLWLKWDGGGTIMYIEDANESSTVGPTTLTDMCNCLCISSSLCTGPIYFYRKSELPNPQQNPIFAGHFLTDGFLLCTNQQMCSYLFTQTTVSPSSDVTCSTTTTAGTVGIGTQAPAQSGTQAPAQSGGTQAPQLGGTQASSGTSPGTVQQKTSGGTQAPQLGGTQASSGTSPGTVQQKTTTTTPTLADAQNLAADASFKKNQEIEYAKAITGVDASDVSVANTAKSARRLDEHMVLSGRSLAAGGILESLFTITVKWSMTLAAVESAVTSANIADAMKAAVASTPAFANITVTVTASTPTKQAASSPTPAPNNVAGAWGSQLTPLVLLAILSSLFFW